MKYLNSRSKFMNNRNEDKLLDFILEGYFRYTDEFDDIIEAILKDESLKGSSTYVIASLFRRLYDRNIETPINYIHVGDDNNTVRFISGKKADKMYDEEKQGSTNFNAKMKMLDHAQKSKDTIKIGRMVRKMIEVYNKEARIRKGIAIRPGHKVELKDKDIEDFVNTYKSFYDSQNNMMDNFMILKGDEISEAYDCNNYWNEWKGTLGDSCMKEVDSGYFDIYTTNDTVSLLTLVARSDSADNSFGALVMGRAILWELNDGDTFMDRIYTTRDSDEKLFIKFARENNFIYKAKQNHSEDGPFFTPHNNYSDSTPLDLTVSVNSDREEEITEFPYMDTMKYFYWKEGEMTNGHRGNGYLYLEDTEGQYSCSDCDEDGEEECDNCGSWGHTDCWNCSSGTNDCSDCDGSGNQECTDCYGRGSETCPECDGEGEIDGETCDHCAGDQEITCQGCGGDGSETCDKCGGDGEEECYDCEGTGKLECDECGGEGTIICDRCGGRNRDD